MNENLVEIKNVNFHYSDVSILENITLNVQRGDFLGIIGPNGSGKSTLLKLMVGLLTPTSGSVRLFGEPAESFRKRDRLGYVPQRVNLSQYGFPLTVTEVVQMGSIGPSSSQHENVREALNAVSMHKYKDRLITELSGGQQQRVFIARAIVNHPEMLILDEPTVGVDIESQRSFYELLKNLNRNHNLTLILVSHDIDVVAKEVSSIACLNKRLLGHVSSDSFNEHRLIEQMYGDNLTRVTHSH